MYEAKSEIKRGDGMIEEYLAGNCPVNACSLPDKCFSFTLFDVLFWLLLFGVPVILYIAIRNLEKRNPKEVTK
jgi:hypothetical protein